MRFSINKLYAIQLDNGHRFGAMCVETDDGYVIFESKSGIQTRHPIDSIVSAKDLSKTKQKVKFTCGLGHVDCCFGCPKFNDCAEEYEAIMEGA
jgi:hypothetical protein